MVGTFYRSASPGAKRNAAALIDAAGGRYVEGAVMTSIPPYRIQVPLLLGGANAIMIGNVIERQFKAANDWPFGSALSFLLMYATFGALALRSLFARRSKGVDI